MDMNPMDMSLPEREQLESMGYFQIRRGDEVSLIEDQSDLEQIAINKRVDEMVRILALNKITNQGVIKDLATDKNENWVLRIAAIEKLEDPNVIRMIATDHDDDKRVSKFAKRKLKDMSVRVNATPNSLKVAM